MAKKEKLKSDEFDFDDDLNFDDLGFGDDDGFEVKDDRKPVTKVLDGAIEGAKDTLTDPAFIRKTVLESLPKEYGESYAKIDEVSTGVVRLYNDAVKEVKPTVTRVLKQVDKLIPQESKRTREFLDKIKEFVGEDYEYKQLSKEQQEEQSIQNSLGAIFQTQGEEQARQRNEDQAQGLIKEQVEKDRFETESGFLASIDNNLAKLTQYNEKINQAYQKKTLELQFRGYFLQQDMLATTKKYFEVFEKQNEAITKNTALPEFVKITKAEAFKEHMRERFNSSVTSGLFGDNNLIKKGFERLSVSLKAKVQEFKSGLEEGVSAATEAKNAFGSEEEGGMGIDKYDFLGKMAGSQGIEKLGEILGKKIREKIDSSDGEYSEKIKKYGFKGATAAGNIPGFLANLRNSDSLQYNWEDGTVKSALKDATKWVLDQFTESGPDMTLAEAPGMNKLGSPAVFDNKVHRSITEIIPGFLSRILQELQITRTGNPAVPLTKFDYDGGKFTTTKKLAEKIKAKLKSDAQSTGYNSRLQETTKRFLGESKFDGKTQEAVQAFIKQKSFDGGAFDPKEMLGEEFLNTIPSSKRKAFKRFVEETYGQDTAKSAKNEFLFSNDMVNLRKNIADLRGSVQTYENAGYGDILRELGIVGGKRGNNTINEDAYRDLLLSEKDERKLAARRAYERAAKGQDDKPQPKFWESESDTVEDTLDGPKVLARTAVGAFKIEEVSLEPITKRLDTIIENMKEGPKEGTALSDIRAKKGISKFDPRQALENIKNTKIFNWMYKKGKGDEQAHVGPMAQDVNATMGEDAAPGGTTIDLVSLNGNNMAAIEALRQEQEVIKEKVQQTPSSKDPQKPVSLLESIKQDTGTIVDLLASKGIVIGTFPSIEFNTDGVEKLAKAFSDSMADYKEKSFEFFESMQKKLSEVSGFGMSMPNMPTLQTLKDSKAAKVASSYFDKIKEKGKVVGTSMWQGTKSLFNFGKERAKDAGGFLKRQYQDKKEPVKEGIGKVFKASFDIAGNVLRGANRIVTETLPAGIRQVKDLLKTVKDKALDILDQPTDIYVLGNPMPAMLANLMKFGHYFDQATGKPIVKPSQIVGPVVDKQGNYVLTAADLSTGIVDKDGNKIETPVKKLIGIGVRAIATGISAANNAVRNVLSIGKGGGEKLLDGFKGMVKKLLPTDIIGFGFDKSHKVLLDIREILNKRLPGEPMRFSDTKPDTNSPTTTPTPQEVPDTQGKNPVQTLLFPEGPESQEPPSNNTGPEEAIDIVKAVKAKGIEAKAKARSLFESVKNKAKHVTDSVAQKLPDGNERIAVGKWVSKLKSLKEKTAGLLQPTATSKPLSPGAQQDLFTPEPEGVKGSVDSELVSPMSWFKQELATKLSKAKQAVAPMAQRAKNVFDEQTAAKLPVLSALKQKAASFITSLKPVKQLSSEEAPVGTKWTAKPLLDKLKDPKKTLSGFAATVSNWLGNEAKPKQQKEASDDLEVKVSEPDSDAKNTDPDKKSVFERITEFTVSGKGKLAELIGDKLSGSLKESVLPKLFGNKKPPEDTDANDGEKDKLSQPANVEPKYKGGNILDSVQAVAAGGLQKLKDSKIGSFVSERFPTGKDDAKEKLSTLFDKLKDSGRKAKEFVTRSSQTSQQTAPQKEIPAETGDLPTPGVLTKGKGLIGGLLGKAGGVVSGVTGMLGGLLPGAGNKAESPAKDVAAEGDKEKPGTLDQIKDLLSGLLKRREGPELTGGKNFNDTDGDGDRDGNAQEQFDRIEQIKKDRDAKTDKTVASLDPRYKSSENIIDTIINKAKGLAGMVAGGGAAGSLLGTAADVAGGLLGRGRDGPQIPQPTVPGGTTPQPTVPKKPSRFGSILKGGAKLGLGAGAAYGLFHLAEKARENGSETLSDALSMGGNLAGAYSAFQGLSGLATLASGAGGVTGAIGSAASGALSGVGTLASGAMSVGGSLLGGAGSALLGAVSAPWVAIPAAAALTGYLGYKGYKYLTRNKASSIEAFRMAQYGLSSGNSDHFSRIYGLEEYLNEKALGYKKGQAYLIDKNVQPEEVFKILDIDPNNKEQMDKSLRWFMVRFKPIYLSHLTALYAVSPNTRLQDVNDVDKEKLSKYLHAVEYPQGPYGDLTSPFADLPKLTASSTEVSAAFKLAKKEVGVQSATGEKGKPLENKNSNSADKLPGEDTDTIPGAEKTEPAEKSLFSKVKDGLQTGLTSVIPAASVVGLGLGIKDKVSGVIPESVATGAKDVFSGFKEAALSPFATTSQAPVNSMLELSEKPKKAASADYLGTGALSQKSEMFAGEKQPANIGTYPAGDGLASFNKDPIIDPVQAGISDYGNGAGLAMGGVGALMAAKAFSGNKKDAVLPGATNVGGAYTQPGAQVANTAAKSVVGAKPSLLSRIGGAVKGRGLKLGLAGGAAYGLFHLAEKARENGNETLSDALSMGGNVAGAYGAFQGLSGLASVMAGSGGVTGALGTLGTATSGAIGTLGSGAATVGSSLLGGGASVLGAVAMNPLFYVPAAAGLLAYGGYKAYKAYKRVKPSPVTKLRLSQYGFTDKVSEHYPPVLKLEEYLNEKVVGYNKGQAYLIEKNINPEEIFNILGVSPKDAEGRSKALQWFVTRFKPVYLNHLTSLYSVAPKARMEDVDGLEDEVKQRYVSAVQMPDGPYDQLVSPIPGMDYLPGGQSAVQKAYEEAESSTGKKNDTKPIKEVLATKESKLGLPVVKDTGNASVDKPTPEIAKTEDFVKKTAAALGVQSVFDRVKSLFTKPTTPFAQPVVSEDTSPLTGLESVRFKLYGAISPTTSQVSAFRSFEQAMYPLLQMDNTLTVKVNAEAVQVLEHYGKLFGVSIHTKEAKVWLDWYFKRFLPVFTSFVGETYKRVFDSKFASNEKRLKPSEHYDVAVKLVGLGNVWVCRSTPFLGEVANTNPSSIDGNMAYLKSVSLQKPMAELTAVTEGKLEPVKQTQLVDKKQETNPATSEDDNYPLPAKKPSVGALGMPKAEAPVDPHPEGEEKIKTQVDKVPKTNTPTGDTSKPVSAPSSIPNAGGPLKSGVGGSKYVKKADSDVDLSGLNPTLAKNFLGMAQEYGEKTGQSVVVNSAFRSYEKQAALHRADPKKAAAPGRSLHEFGLAMDINSQIANKLESLGLMKKYGFTRPIGGEGWHVEPAGIQANIDKAKHDKQFAEQAIAASPGRGGGGAWDDRSTDKYRRNTKLALATFKAGSAQPIDLPETKTAKDTSTLPSPVQASPASTEAGASPDAKQDVGNSQKPGVSGLLTSSKPASSNKVAGSVPGTVRSVGGASSQEGESPRSPSLEPRPKPMSGSIPGTVAGRNSGQTQGEPEANDTYNKSPKSKVVSGKEGVKDVIAQASKKAGVQPDYMQTIAAIESTLNPQATSPTGKAVGLYQFFPETWAEITQKAGRKYGITPSTPRSDPYASTIMAAEYAKAGQSEIKKYKNNPGAADFYLSHFLGPYGGPKMVASNPNAIAANIAPKAAASKGNSSMFYKDKARTQPFTVAEFYNNIVNKLKTRADQFGIKFTNKFYEDSGFKQAEGQDSDTSGSREEAEYASADQNRGVMRNGKTVKGNVAGTVRDVNAPAPNSKSPSGAHGNTYAETATGNEPPQFYKTTASKKTDPSYTTRDGDVITIRELPPLSDEERAFKPTKLSGTENKLGIEQNAKPGEAESIYALNNYSVGNNKAVTTPVGYFDNKQSTAPAQPAESVKKDNTYVPRNKSTVSIAEVPVQTALNPKPQVSLTGGLAAAGPTVLGGSSKTEQRDLPTRTNLASGVDTTSIILNESLSVQRQMLDVLKNILSKPVPQAQPVQMANTVQQPVQPQPAQTTEAQSPKSEPPPPSRVPYNPPTEALPKAAVSLRRVIA